MLPFKLISKPPNCTGKITETTLPSFVATDVHLQAECPDIYLVEEVEHQAVALGWIGGVNG